MLFSMRAHKGCTHSFKTIFRFFTIAFRCTTSEYTAGCAPMEMESYQHNLEEVRTANSAMDASGNLLSTEIES